MGILERFTDITAKIAITKINGAHQGLLDNPARLIESLKEVARRMNWTTRSSFFEQFSPVGVTGGLILAESAIIVHTWPELGQGKARFNTELCAPDARFSGFPEAVLDVFGCQEVLHEEFTDTGFVNPGTRIYLVRTPEGAKKYPFPSKD